MKTPLIVSQRMYQVHQLALPDHIEPFDATAVTSATLSSRFSGWGSQSAYLDAGSNQPLSPTFAWTPVSLLQPQYSQSGPRNPTSPIRVSGTWTQPRIGKGGLRAQQYHDVRPPVQFDDSGVRFNGNGEQAADPSQLPNEVPPSYAPQ